MGALNKITGREQVIWRDEQFTQYGKDMTDVESGRRSVKCLYLTAGFLLE